MGLRFQDQTGEWSDPILQGFGVIPIVADTEIPNAITRMEFYLDTDPGMDNGMPLILDQLGTGQSSQC